MSKHNNLQKKSKKKIDAKTKVIQQAEEPTKKNDKKENGKKEQEQQVEVGVKVDNVQEPSTQAPEQTANHDNSTKKKKKQKKKKGKTTEVDQGAAEGLLAKENPTVEAGSNGTKKKKKNKKNKTADQTAEVDGEGNTAQELKDSPMIDGDENGTKKKQKATPNKPFKRIDASQVTVNNGLASNSYNAKKGGDIFGQKANEVLSAVRGKDFRHAKTKKKRGTYRGGEIDFGVNSFKFAKSDDEEE